jgi:hypothetical protein
MKIIYQYCIKIKTMNIYHILQKNKQRIKIKIKIYLVFKIIIYNNLKSLTTLKLVIIDLILINH